MRGRREEKWEQRKDWGDQNERQYSFDRRRRCTMHGEAGFV
jgi:hypothetical protein